jgi:tetratricopeptide (TPR) repeat protein
MGIYWFGRLWAVPFFFIASVVGDTSTLNQQEWPQDASAPSNNVPGARTLVIKLYSDHTGTLLEKQAVLKLKNLTDNSAIWETTDDRSEVVFASVASGRYDIEVSAIGYAGLHQELQVVDSLQVQQIEIVLRRDASAIAPDFSDGIIPSKARKLTKHAIAHLKSEKLTQAQKQLDQAYSLAPFSPDVNFLLGYLYFRQRNFVKAGMYLDTTVKLSPQNAEAFTLLGRSHLEREDYSAARSVLEQAVLLDFENWLPHNLLADAYLREGNYERARDEAEIAIRKGGHVASPSRLIVSRSLLETGRDKEAVEALSVFLEESPQHPMAGQVRNLIAKINEHIAGVTVETTVVPAIEFSEFDPLRAVGMPILPRTSWQPPGVDEVRPLLAPGDTCPFAEIMEQSGKRVEELVQNVERFAAIEDLLHQNLDNYGVPIRTLTRKYNYVASITEPSPGFLNVDEYRAEKHTVEDYPDRIASTGFAALALVFHPHTRESFTMSCEGLGDWHGHASWLVHFRQREDRPNHMHGYQAGNQVRPIGLKGRAWIAADTFQIVRIEADIIHPAPEIQLLSEHQIVEYGPVPFPKKNRTIWLPKTAQIYFDLRKHHYYRRHSFDHYMLFSVDSDERRKEPTPTGGRDS